MGDPTRELIQLSNRFELERYVQVTLVGATRLTLD